MIYKAKIAYRCAYAVFYKSEYFLAHAKLGFWAYAIGVAAIYIGGYKSPPMFRYAQNVPPNKSLGIGI